MYKITFTITKRWRFFSPFSAYPHTASTPCSALTAPWDNSKKKNKRGSGEFSLFSKLNNFIERVWLESAAFSSFYLNLSPEHMSIFPDSVPGYKKNQKQRKIIPSFSSTDRQRLGSFVLLTLWCRSWVALLIFLKEVSLYFWNQSTNGRT